MTAATMVERVAEAIHDAANREAGQDEYCSYAMAKEAARAAIEAMREPTDTMMEAGDDIDCGGITDPGARAFWRVMIGAALKGEG